jgi:hypothetical protein
MRMKTLIAIAVMIAALAGATRPAAAYWWPWYSYYGYDYRFGYYGSPSAGPTYFYLPPKPEEAGPVCVTRRVWVDKRWQLVCS